MLVGHGTLQAGEPFTLELRGAVPTAAATLVVGFSSLFAPFKGGVLVPQPNFLLPGFVTSAEGGALIAADWPDDMAAGLETWYQFWSADAAAGGVAASNGAMAVAP